MVAKDCFLVAFDKRNGTFSFLQDRRMNQVRVSFEQYRYEYYTVMKQWKDLQQKLLSVLCTIMMQML